jgi:hypothetical protein
MSQMSGEHVEALAEAVSDAIVEAQSEGLTIIQAISTVAIVAADYGRAVYGDEVLDSLAKTIKARRGASPPDVVLEPLLDS